MKVHAAEINLNGSIPEHFQRTANRHPQRLAVRDRSQELTYDELNRAANRLAHTILDARGEGQEAIAVLVEQGVAAVVAILGVLKAGKAYVPLDKSHPVARLSAILEDSQAGLLITNHQNLALSETLAHSHVLNLDALPAGVSEDNPGLSIAPTTLLNIMYTSGSTGRPKGALQIHRNLLHAVLVNIQFSPRSPEDRFLLLASYSMGASAATMFQTLLTGGVVVIYDLKTEGIDRLADGLTREEITHVHCVPTVFRHLLASLEKDQVLPSLRHIALGGEPTYRRDVALFKRHFQPGCQLRVGFGTTENYLSTQITLDHDSEITSPIVPLGYPIDGMRILILDPSGSPLPAGEIGEIGIQSRFLSPGYWRKPDFTQEVYRPDPNGGDQRIYLTGDLGRLDADGCLHHLGRKDGQVKIRGNRVETGEVEVALLECTGVREAVVLGREKRPGEMALVAYVVLNGTATVPDLRDILITKLPGYMIPSVVMVLDRLPLLPFGKVDLKALPDPEASRPMPSAEFVPPQTSVERALAGIWCDLLDLPAVGVLDNFFELGGNSLLAAQVASRIRKELHVDLAVGSIFEWPTIGALAVHVTSQNDPPAKSEQGTVDPESLKRALRLLGPM